MWNFPSLLATQPSFNKASPAGEAIRSFRECRDCKASENVTLALRIWVVKVLNWSDLSNAEFSVFLVSNAEFSKVCVPQKSPQTGVKFEPPKKSTKIKGGFKRWNPFQSPLKRNSQRRNLLRLKDPKGLCQLDFTWNPLNNQLEMDRFLVFSNHLPFVTKIGMAEPFFQMVADLGDSR